MLSLGLLNHSMFLNKYYLLIYEIYILFFGFSILLILSVICYIHYPVSPLLLLKILQPDLGYLKRSWILNFNGFGTLICWQNTKENNRTLYFAKPYTLSRNNCAPVYKIYILSAKYYFLLHYIWRSYVIIHRISRKYQH